jgi:aryl-alcohol dehydrogenase-like predicted oxidoreductase
MIDRRKFLGMAAGAGASLALTPQLLRALQQSQGQLIQRAIPSTGELLPVIGVARGPVQNNARLAHLVDMVDPSSEAYRMLKSVVKTMVDNGGRVLESSPGEPQQVTGMIADELGIQKKVFWATGFGIPQAPESAPMPDAATIKANLDAVFARLKVPTIDLVMLSASNPRSISALPMVLEVVRQAKAQGRIRYIGVSELPAPSSPYATLISLLRNNEPLDFIGVPHYHMNNRRAEETLLPLAQERKIAVATYMPFELSRLFQRAGNRPLPEWAADFDAKTWAQFFLKYIVSHPAVTVVLPGTSSAAHMLDNIGGGIGRLPDAATRKRMVELVDSFPPVQSLGQQSPGRVTQAPAPAAIVLSAAVLDRYVGEYKAVSGTATFTFRRDGTALYVNPGLSAPLIARAETRFLSAGPGPVFEFQLDAQGKVTGVVLEQDGQKTVLARK